MGPAVRAHAFALGALAVLALALAACGEGGAGPDAGASPDLAIAADPLIEARPYASFAPADYDDSKAWPLVIALHGTGINGFFLDAFYGLSKTVDSRGFLLALPDATKRNNGMTAWNYDEPGRVDDVAYLDAVIADMAKRYRVDPARVYLTGHSNGGAMTWRYACERAGKVAAIAPFAGAFAGILDSQKCNPARPVPALHVNGDMDPNWPGNPPVRDLVAEWAKKNGCGAATQSTAAAKDLVSNLAGAETTAEKWTACPAGAAVELWVMHGAPHSPNLQQPGFSNEIVDWLLANSRP